MIKKIIFVLVLCYMTISCGKKGDPVFKESKKKNEIQNIHINNV